MATVPLTISQMTAWPLQSFDGSEQMPLVSDYTGPLLNYSVTTSQLAYLLPGIIYQPTILEDQASYASIGTDTRILVKNSMALSTTITLLPSSSYLLPILVKDIGGFASDVNPITVNFSGGQTIDGLSSITITNPYGWFTFNPLAAGNFYAT